MDRTLGHNGTAIHDVKAVAHVEAEVQVLFDQKNAELVALTQLFDRLTDLVDDVRLDTLGRFVKQKDFGIGQERARNGQLLLLPAAQDASLALGHFLEHRKELENPLDFAIKLLPLGYGADPKIIRHRQVWKDVPALRDVTDPLPNALFGFESSSSRFAQFDRAGV